MVDVGEEWRCPEKNSEGVHDPVRAVASDIMIMLNRDSHVVLDAGLNPTE